MVLWHRETTELDNVIVPFISNSVRPVQYELQVIRLLKDMKVDGEE